MAALSFLEDWSIEYLGGVLKVNKMLREISLAFAFVPLEKHFGVSHVYVQYVHTLKMIVKHRCRSAWGLRSSAGAIVQSMNRRGLGFQIILLIALVFAPGAYCQGSSAHPRGDRSKGAHKFDNSYLSMTILPGWRVANSGNQRLSLIRDGYLLYVNPIFTHASGIVGGRFVEVMSGMPSIDAVMSNVDEPAGGFECSQSDQTIVDQSITLVNLYTDRSKSGNGCTFPAGRRSVWFGSFCSGTGSESEYTITLSYNSSDVNELPTRGSPQLRQVFRETVAMLKTLTLKPPIEISRISPEATVPGGTVTVYGRGFRVANFTTAVVFSGHPNTSMSPPDINRDGTSLTFEVPPSLDTMSCQPGYIEIAEDCVSTPPNHVNVNDCPPGSYGKTNFCGIPLPPGKYQIYATFEATGVSSNSVALTVTAPQPRPVFILLIYPANLVSAGDTVTVRGSGFTSTGNTIKIGSAWLRDLPSTDGQTITLQAPALSGYEFPHGVRLKASVLNANGESNAIFLTYR